MSCLLERAAQIPSTGLQAIVRPIKRLLHGRCARFVWDDHTVTGCSRATFSSSAVVFMCVCVQVETSSQGQTDEEETPQTAQLLTLDSLYDDSTVIQVRIEKHGSGFYVSLYVIIT